MYSMPPRTVMSGMGSRRARASAACALRGGGVGDLYGWALFGDGFYGFFFVELGPVCGEIAGDAGYRHFGLADDGAEGAPLFAERVFLHAGGYAHALGVDFGVEDFGFVGLAGVEEAALGFGAVLRDVVEVAAGVEHFLCGEDADVGHFYGGFYADALFFGFDGGESGFVGEDVAAESEFAGGDDGLFDEEALFAAAYRAAADFVAGVADGGIGIEAGLLAAGFGGADFGFGLAEGGIVGVGYFGVVRG